MAGKPRYAGMGDDAVERATGRTWAAWIETLEREDAKAMTARELEAMLRQEFRLPAWWAQMVAAGYGQAGGARAPNHAARGLRAHASRTIAADAQRTFAAFREDAVRREWLRDAALEVRASTAAESLRMESADGPSVVGVAIRAKGAGRSQVVIDEDGLPDAAAAKRRKVFWREALDRLQGLLEA